MSTFYIKFALFLVLICALNLLEQFSEAYKLKYLSPPWMSKKRVMRRHSKVSLPFFDSNNNMPTFVYRPTTGEKILNTMLSRARYVMLEPVPGQVLYPPTVPLFRSMPIEAKTQPKLQVTMLPFYEHEAVTIHSSTERPTPRLSMPRPIGFKMKSTSRHAKEEKSKSYAAYSAADKVIKPCTTELSTVRHANHRSSLEKPIVKLSSRYSVSKDRPSTVYSLGKLLSTVHKPADATTDTWFIVNSRYKGQTRRDNKEHQSKYKLENDNFNPKKQFVYNDKEEEDTRNNGDGDDDT